MPADGAPVFEPTRRAIDRIAKEGRKYGVSLCLVSQRPVRALHQQPVAVRHDHRPAHQQRARPAVRPQGPARRLRLADRRAARPGDRRGGGRRRGRLGADADPVPPAGCRRAAGEPDPGLQPRLEPRGHRPTPSSTAPSAAGACSSAERRPRDRPSPCRSGRFLLDTPLLGAPGVATTLGHPIPMLDKTYRPAEVEPRIYAEWEASGASRPAATPAAPPYCIMLPPPNVTGSLHMGHALDHTIQDTLVRFHRMRGRRRALAAGHRPCRHRHADGGRAPAGGLGQQPGPPRARPRGVRRQGLGVEGAVRRHHRPPDAPARRLRRTGAASASPWTRA